MSLLAGLLVLTATAAAPQLETTRICGPETDRIVLLGTAGGPTPSAVRAQAATALVIGGTPYLFDVGDGSVRRLAEAGFPANAVRHVFITHNHFDHTGDLGLFLATAWFADLPRPIEIVGPKGTREVVTESLAAFRHSIEIFNSEVMRQPLRMDKDVIVREVAPGGVVFEDERMKVRAYENTHFAHLKPGTVAYGRDQSLSYRIETRGRVITITGDSGADEVIQRAAQNADFLVSEVLDPVATRQFVNARAKKYNYSPERAAGTIQHMLETHIQADMLGKIAANAKVKTVILTHFVPNTGKDSSAFVNGVGEAFRGRIIAGQDLMEIPINEVSGEVCRKASQRFKNYKTDLSGED
ncbi:MBL fold metallo-hydrolase [Novosphingobium sp. Leaf2]|uniref:MBL fold metallo-hydrolase n=1 Tax=Novosphingobium sp. Leaf2 TaxID=1735670 RepID=UPI000ADE404B|nr:MBL fold metallo-hydrolase [Novosphingobium sp. Leaf2]